MHIDSPLKEAIKKLEQNINDIYIDLQNSIEANRDQVNIKIKNILDEIKDIKITLKRLNTIEHEQSATYKNIDALDNYLKALENRIEAIENKNKEKKETKRFVINLIMMIAMFILGLYGSEIKTFISKMFSFDHQIEKKDKK